MDDTAENYNEEATYDDGSCEYPFSCDDGYIADCNGNCAPASWVGDNICDDGGYTSGGASIYLNCDNDNDGVIVGTLCPTDLVWTHGFKFLILRQLKMMVRVSTQLTVVNGSLVSIDVGGGLASKFLVNW